MPTFGSYIKDLRSLKGWTLQTLAEKCGTHKGYASGWETGSVNPPSPKIVKKLAAVLGVKELPLLLMAYAEKAPKEIKDYVKAKLL